MIKELLLLLDLSDSDRTKTQAQLDTTCQALRLIEIELNELMEMVQINVGDISLNEAQSNNNSFT